MGSRQNCLPSNAGEEERMWLMVHCFHSRMHFEFSSTGMCEEVNVGRGERVAEKNREWLEMLL